MRWQGQPMQLCPDRRQFASSPRPAAPPAHHRALLLLRSSCCRPPRRIGPGRGSRARSSSPSCGSPRSGCPRRPARGLLRAAPSRVWGLGRPWGDSGPWRSGVKIWSMSRPPHPLSSLSLILHWAPAPPACAPPPPSPPAPPPCARTPAPAPGSASAPPPPPSCAAPVVGPRCCGWGRGGVLSRRREIRGSGGQGAVAAMLCFASLLLGLPPEGRPLLPPSHHPSLLPSLPTTL